MNSRLIRKMLQSFGTYKASYDDSHYTIEKNNKLFKILFIKSSKDTQITINSPTVVEVVKGRLSGIRYKKLSSTLHRFDSKDIDIILVINTKPYRILKYLNENQISQILINLLKDPVFSILNATSQHVKNYV